ncbi:hypothetical protein L7F22_020413 [Adiantum nelumboides]|nr:hypothetical protein [Adiantum nelumboides]
MINVRKSIINRRSKPPAITTHENRDKEFEEEMGSLRRRQMHYAWKEAEVRQSVSPRRVETLRRQSELRAAMEEQLKVRESSRQQLIEEEKTFDRYNQCLASFCGPHSTEEEIMRQQHRKDYLKGLMDENIRLSTLKKELQEKEKELEAEMDRVRATTPCTWNRRHYL